MEDLDTDQQANNPDTIRMEETKATTTSKRGRPIKKKQPVNELKIEKRVTRSILGRKGRRKPNY